MSWRHGQYVFFCIVPVAGQRSNSAWSYKNKGEWHGNLW